MPKPLNGTSAAVSTAARPPRRGARSPNSKRARACGEPLDRLDSPALDLAHRHQAGTDLTAVEPHGAGAAVAGIATHLGAGEAKVVAQGGGKARDRWPLPSRGTAVQGEGDLHAAKL